MTRYWVALLAAIAGFGSLLLLPSGTAAPWAPGLAVFSGVVGLIAVVMIWFEPVGTAILLIGAGCASLAVLAVGLDMRLIPVIMSALFAGSLALSLPSRRTEA